MSWQAVFYIFGASATLWLPLWFVTKIPKQRLESTEAQQRCVEVESQAQSVSLDSEGVQGSTDITGAASNENELLLNRPQAAPASEISAISRAPEFEKFLGSVGMDTGFIALTQRKEVWAICAAQYCNSWGAYALLNWLPTYFSEQVCCLGLG